MGPETKSALIGALAVLIGAFAGFGGLILQLRSQGRQSRVAIAENERRRLKAEMYEDAVVVAEALTDAATGLSSQLLIMMIQLDIAAASAASGVAFTMPSARSQGLLTLYDVFTKAATRLVSLVEQRRIIDPRLTVFRTAIGTVLHSSRGLMFSEFVVNVLPILPMQGLDGQLYPYPGPSIEQAKCARELGTRFTETLNDAVSYSEDFLIEMQNLLLGDLFDRQLAHREPPDPNSRVIRLDDEARLETYFRSETAWGREISLHEAQASARFSDTEPTLGAKGAQE